MVTIDKEIASSRIAKNIAALFNDVEDITILNLGVGIPTQVSNYITNDNVFIQAENGMLGVGPIAVGDEIHPQLINAGRQPVKETPGCAFFDSSTSFGMIRGGHIDATVIGAFEVDQHGNVANWIIPNGKMLGVGGAMDLVVGAKKVIIALMHTSKGKSKLLKECTLPITGFGEVDVVVTELAMFFFENGKIILKAIAPEVDVDYVRSVTEFEFTVSADLKVMEA
ncbi:acetate CoA-transferase [Anaerosporomusa subterranea]|uniref:Acetate CoA-transferase n=1 Tax=Anaerosporomusa subterranea TaxID=1794912 RepID=A0A154BQG5_ANASB|nr:3-oxoacid CoA-transferase subunit B [Anaerosporomusa subterranea]KYZ76263.1 acetate CoA-transferase [Anaerosporomusa subterranea]